MPREDGLSKKITLEYDLSYVIWKIVFFLRKIWYFFFGRKMKDDLSQEIHGNMIFSVYMYKMFQIWCYPSAKKSKMIFSRKNTLNIDILDCILERVSTILCTFKETFIGIFIYCFPVKKNPRKLNTLDRNLTSSIYLVGDILLWRIFNALYHSVLRSYI